MKTDSNDEIATTEEERAIDWLLEHVQGAIYYREQRAIRFPDDERNETSAEALGKLEIHIENGLPEDIRRGLVIAVDTPDTEDGDTLDTEDGDTLDGNIELFDLDDFNRALGRFGFDDPQADPAEFLSCFFAGLTDKAYEPRED